MLSPHPYASPAIPGCHPGSRRRASGKTASGGLTVFRHPITHVNPRTDWVFAEKTAEGGTHRITDLLTNGNDTYGLDSPKLALQSDGGVFIAGKPIGLGNTASQSLAAGPGGKEGKAFAAKTVRGRNGELVTLAADGAMTSSLAMLALFCQTAPQSWAINVQFPKYWPTSGAYNFTLTGSQLPVENTKLIIRDEGGEEVWSGFTDDTGTAFPPIMSNPALVTALANSSKTFSFYLRPESELSIGSSTLHPKVVKGRFSDAVSVDFEFLIKSQKGGSGLTSSPLRLKTSESSDARAASGSMNMLWVYKRAMQFLGGARAADFDNFQFWWNPTLGNDGITRFNPSGNRMYVRGNRSDNADDFDDGVLLHELGHKVHTVFGPYRSLPSFTAPTLSNGHIANAAIDPELAWVEGWANFFQAAVKMSPSSGYPSGYQTTAMYDSGANGKATNPLVDPGPSGLTPSNPWSNEIRVSRGLYLMLNNPGIGNGAIGTFLNSLNPGSGMDGFRSFLDRLGSGPSAAITTVLVSDGFTNPPPSPMDAPASLTLNTPSTAFRLLPQTLIPGTSDYMTPREGSAYFTCVTTAGNDLRIRIQGLASSDVASLGIRIINSSVVDFKIPGDLPAGPPYVQYDAGTNTFNINLPAATLWAGPLSLISVYNRSQTRTLSNLVLTVIE